MFDQILSHCSRTCGDSLPALNWSELYSFFFLTQFPLIPFIFPHREALVHTGGVSDAGQRRFHRSGAQQQNAQHQELLPEEERDQVCVLSPSHT